MDYLKGKIVKKVRSPKRPGKSFYLVRRGDSLTRIARRFRTTVHHLKKANNLSNSKIYPGQKLRLSTTKYQSAKSQRYYFVRRGDNLNTIARKFRLSLTKIKKFNNLVSDRIYVGQKLLVGPKTFVYRVQPGDSLGRISRMYGVPVRKIKRQNSLRSSRINAGQRLKIF